MGYKDCLAAMYARERENQGAIAAGGSLIRYWRPHHVPPPRRERIVFSGLPAKKVVVGKVWSYFGRHPLENTRDRVWLTGADAHLFRLGTDKAEHGVSYQITAVRSLPRGIYRFQLRRQEARFQPCDYYDSLAAIDYVVEAMAPPGVVSEAFFNPVRDGSRLGVDLRHGPSEKDIVSTGEETELIESVQWEDGEVWIAVNSQETIEYKLIEFVRSDGAVSLVLDARAAGVRDSTSGVELTWQLPAAPWKEGEELMVRVRSEDGTMGSGQPGAGNPTCVMNHVGALSSQEWLSSGEIISGSFEDCGKTLRPGGYSSYAVFRLFQTEEVRISLRRVCPSLEMRVFTGIGTDGQLLHEFDSQDLLIHNVRQWARLGALPAGPYTVDLSVLNPGECPSLTLTFKRD